MKPITHQEALAYLKKLCENCPNKILNLREQNPFGDTLRYVGVKIVPYSPGDEELCMKTYEGNKVVGDVLLDGHLVLDNTAIETPFGRVFSFKLMEQPIQVKF